MVPTWRCASCWQLFFSGLPQKIKSMICFWNHQPQKRICDSCLAMDGKGAPDAMNYRNLGTTAGWPLTCITHQMYLNMDSNSLSPWISVPGWKLETVSWDLMHNLFLGTGRDLVASSIRALIDCGVFGDGELDDILDIIHLEMHRTCAEHGFLEMGLVVLIWWFVDILEMKLLKKCGSLSGFLQSWDCNLSRFYLPLKPVLSTSCIGGLSDYAEMSPRYKASHIKRMIWWIARKTHEISEQRPDETWVDLYNAILLLMYHSHNQLVLTGFNFSPNCFSISLFLRMWYCKFLLHVAMESSIW